MKYTPMEDPLQVQTVDESESLREFKLTLLEYLVPSRDTQYYTQQRDYKDLGEKSCQN